MRIGPPAGYPADSSTAWQCVARRGKAAETPPGFSACLANRTADMVRLDGVGLRYGRGPYVLEDLNFALAPGSFRWLLGPSGAGKTSLLRLLTLAVRPTNGR